MFYTVLNQKLYLVLPIYLQNIKENSFFLKVANVRHSILFIVQFSGELQRPWQPSFRKGVTCFVRERILPEELMPHIFQMSTKKSQLWIYWFKILRSRKWRTKSKINFVHYLFFKICLLRLTLILWTWLRRTFEWSGKGRLFERLWPKEL